MQRRVPLQRRVGLTRTGITRSRTELRRSRLRRESDAHLTARADHPEVRLAVFQRDRWTCRLAGVAEAGPCGGPLTPHHLLKEKHGGAYTLANLVTCCAVHNGWIEDHPELGPVR